MVIVVDCKFIARAPQVRILLSPYKDKWLSGLKHLSWKQKYIIYHGFESRLVCCLMKRVNPILIRLFLNTNHKYQLLLTNFYKNFKFYYYLTNLIIFSLRKLSIFKRFIFIFNYFMLAKSSGFFLFFQYFFITKKIQFKIKKKNFVSISYFIKTKIFSVMQLLYFLFWRLESIVFFKFALFIYFFPQNVYNFIINIKNYHYLFNKRVFKNYKKYCRLILLANLGLYLKSGEILTYCISQAIRKNKKHHQSLSWFLNILNFLLKYQPGVNGLLIRVGGRFNNNIQAKSRIICLGKPIKLNRFNTQLNYFYRTIVTPIGIFGIKIWII